MEPNEILKIGTFLLSTTNQLDRHHSMQITRSAFETARLKTLQSDMPIVMSGVISYCNDLQGFVSVPQSRVVNPESPSINSLDASESPVSIFIKKIKMSTTQNKRFSLQKRNWDHMEEMFNTSYLFHSDHQ